MAGTDGAQGPLSDLRVLDLSRVLSGPHCGRLLVDLGADVVKVEPPEGDLTRFSEPRVGSLALYFVQQNCGKRNISLDLRRPQATGVLRRLCEQADVVLENFRAGVMERLGLGYEEVSTANPGVVYGSITGYGRAGVWAGRRAYAPVIHAEAGLLEGFARMRGIEAAQEPYSHADVYAGLYCFGGIMAALHQRARTGRGQHVEVAMAEALMCATEYGAAALSGLDGLEGTPPPPTIASPVVTTADGETVTVAGDPAARENFGGWCQALGRPDLGDDERFATPAARHAHREDLLEVIRAWAAGVPTAAELEVVLAEAGLAVGVVRSLARIGDTPWARERGAAVTVSDRAGGTLRIPNSPWRFTGATAGARGEPAYRGEHNREVLSEYLGLDGSELDALEAAGVLSSRLPSGR